MEIRIPEDCNGMLLRTYLTRSLALSSKMIKHIKFLPNGIAVNGEPKTVRYLLRTGDLLSLALEDTESAPILPIELPIEILYEDPDLVVPAKPADMPTHPSCDHYNDTVANALAFRYAQSGTPFVFRPINRLDRNTSGLLLIARNRPTAATLTKSMQKGEIRKQYLAVLDGEMTQREGRIDACLHRTAESIILREVCAPDALDASPSLTEYRVLAVGQGHTLVQASPITGRTHQLRVHFASIGHPITGDDLYGTPDTRIARHALHAHRLSFPHPKTNETVSLTAPLPADLTDLIAYLFPNITL
ncbi:MAG: RluA family pseudouridine synthase [Ruminococcaceae bacterium]|nr:RluA family pseudouridine synthase [Oscillospiraceae bacterium]